MYVTNQYETHYAAKLKQTTNGCLQYMKMNKRLDLTEMATTWCDYGAFMDKFILQSTSSSHQIPLSGLTFAVKDIFDVEGYVTGFGNPDWARTHSPASSTAEVVSALLAAGAICVGKTIIDEMACSSSTNGENQHYGTPKNPCAADRVPGGSSSGSAVAVAAMLVDFSLGSDTGGSIRAPGSYCGIFGFRPSHGLVSTAGLISMAQSFDTVGWFARDPTILNRVGRVLLKLPATNPIKPTRFVVAKDCFELSSVPYDRTALVLIKAVEKVFGCNISYAAPGDYVKEKVPSLKHFMSQENKDQDHKIPSLAALSSAMQLLQKYEFKKNYGEWITTVNPLLGPGISERVWDAVRTTDEGIDSGLLVKKEPRASLREFLEDYGVFAILTLPGPPPVLQTDPSTLETFRAKAFSLLSIAGVSGFCQVIIPLGLHNNLPVSVSLLTRHGSDGFLLNVVETLYDTLKEQKALA